MGIIVANDFVTLDGYPDPWAITPNPVTGELWSYPQISSFLFDRSGGDVFVAPSTGTSFLARALRHDWFCIGDEVCLTGDFDGDGRDDLVAFTRGTTADVYVAFSTGAAFNGTGVKWHDFFAANGELPFAGDVNHDGRDDLVSFARGTLGRVYVARSSGAAFVGTNAIWTTNLCLGTDVCGLADVTGDGRADALGFHRHD